MERERAHRPVVIVTGASRGIGAAVARWLGQRGASVTLVARSEASLRQVASDVENLGGRCLVVAGDVADPDTCIRAVKKTLDRFYRLDGLVNNAGILQPLKTTFDASPDEWRYNLEVNVLGPVYFIKAALPELRIRHGRIVNVSSGASGTVIEAAGAYCASKAALTHFTRVLAAEEPDLTAVSVRPGVVDTRMQEVLRREGPRVMPQDQAVFYLNLKSDNQLEPPEVPGRAIAWLVLHTPNSWSGRFFNYDDTEIFGPAVETFGEKTKWQ